MSSRIQSTMSSVAALAVCTLLAGCGALQPGTDIGFGAPSGAGTISGSVHGGAQVITGATISLYISGTVAVPATNTQASSFNYGQGAQLRAVTTTSGTGGFNFVKNPVNNDIVTPATNAWACPTTGDPIVYLVGTGGNPTGNGMATPTNSAISLMAVLGKCSTISAATRVFMNEVTTVASVAAMQQFLNPNPALPSIGGSSSTMSVKALADAAETVTNLVDIAKGSTRTIVKTASTGTNVAGIGITITPENSKINTMANILAACVSSTSTGSGTPCGILFANAVAPTAAYTSQPTATFNAATDTLTAAYYMLTNPTNGGSVTNNATALNNLFGLQNSTPPFSPVLAQVPTDWTIGVRYDALGQTCGTAGNTAATATAVQKYLGYAYHLAIDGNGDIYATNGILTTSTTTGGVGKLSATGTPLACIAGGVGAVTSNPGLSAASITADGTSIWLTSQASVANQLYRLNTSTFAVDTFNGVAANVNPILYNIVDGGGAVYYSFTNRLYKISATDAATTTPGATNYGVAISTGVKTQPYFMAIDGGGSIYNGYQASTTAASETTFQTYPTSLTVATGNSGAATAGIGYYKTVAATNSVATVQVGPNPSHFGIAVGINGKVWSANSTCGSIATPVICDNQSQFVFYSPTASAKTDNSTIAGGAVTVSTPGFAGVSGTREIAIDGAGNIWGPNSTVNTGNYAAGDTTAVNPTTCNSSFNCYSLAAVAYDGTALSASGTATTMASSGTPVLTTGGFQKSFASLPVPGRGIAISPAGNVWIGSNSSAGTGLTEIVGAAVPVVTPLAKAQSMFSTNGGNIVPKP